MKGYIRLKDMYTPNAYFECDRDKNYLCPIVKQNQPCGNCKGTRYIKFAKIYDERRNGNV